MGFHFVARLLFVALFLPVLGHSQKPEQPPVQRDPQAVAVLAQAVAALSPSAVQDAQVEGTYTDAEGNSGTISIKCKMPDMVRHDISVNGRSVAIVLGGRTGIGRQDGERADIPFWVTKYRKSEIVLQFSRLSEYLRPETNLAYVGLEEVSGQPAHHIRLWAAPTDDTPPELEELMSEFHVFVDAKSGLVVKTITFDFSPEIIENRMPVESFFDDFRQFGPILLPFHVTRIVQGQKQSEITLNSVKLNVGLSDADFQQ